MVEQPFAPGIDVLLGVCFARHFFFFFRLGKIENVLFLEHTRVVYIINKLRDSKYIIWSLLDSKYIKWSLLEVNHLILNVGELDRKPVVS